MLKPTLKIIGVITGSLWLLFVILSIVLIAFVSSNKNEITRAVLLSLNDMQSGEFKLENVEFTSFKQFPDISINLKNLTYFEAKSAYRKPDEQPIARIKNFYLGLDVIKFINGNLNIRKLLIDGGELTVVTYADSSINFLNAFKIQEKKIKIDKNEKSLGREDVRVTEIEIDQLTIKDMKLKFQNFLNERESIFILDNFKASFNYMGKSANLKSEASLMIEKLKLNENISLKNKNLKIDVQAHLDENKKLEIKKCKLDLEDAVFNLDGVFDPVSDGELLLNIDGSDAGLNLFTQLLRKRERKNLKKGDFYFKGTVKGKTFIEFPVIDFSFNVKNVELINPTTKRKIKHLNIKGHFNSGLMDDLSEAKLKIDTLYADFPDGTINMSGVLNNFIVPEADFQLYLKTDVTGLDKIFKLDFINDLKGIIEIKDRFKGKYLVEEKRFASEINNANIFLENFGFDIPGAIKVDKVNGSILRKNNDYYIDNLSVISDDTDFLINGEIKNLQYLIFNIEKEINANLTIKSSVFDLPNFLAFDPSIKRDFPHRILNLDLLVDATTNTSKVLHFKSFPEISFDIKKLKATAEGFLPTIDINSGIFKVSESALGFHMDFDHFKTEFLDGRFDINGSYNSSSYQPYYIKTDIEMDGIKISKLLFDENKDSIPEFYNGKMYGSLFLELQFANDTTQVKLLNINKGNIDYFYGEDSIQIKSLAFNSEEIDYNLNKNPNPLATLYSKGFVKADEVKTNDFRVNDLNFNYFSKNGNYEFDNKLVKFFGDNSRGVGKYLLKPFIENPAYRIQFDITRFDMKEMLNTFLEDTIVTGNMALSMDISMNGNNWDEMVSTMKGHLNLKGKNLVMYGMDTDKIIADFQRSQNFNLVDAGAVLLAGPVGLAITKGTDFAKILITNPGQSSHITQLVSNWNAKDGLLMLEDVALSTNKNRVAAKGWLNVVKDSLNISFGVVDDNGCSIFTQDVYGDLNEPTLGKVKVVSTLLAPVTNLYNSIMDVNCQVFYNGLVNPPTKK